MDKPKPRLPEIGEYVRGQGTLVAVQDIIPPPPLVEKDFIFEEITAEVKLFLGKEVLNNIETLWDAYGKGSSIEGAIEDAKEYASKRNIGPTSELEVVVIKVIEQVRKRPDSNRYAENYSAPTIVPFKPLEWRSKADLPDPVRTMVWSSRGNVKS